MLIIGIIAVVILVFLFGKESGKTDKDIKVMLRYGITNKKEQFYLINRFGRGNVTDFKILDYFIECDCGEHPEFRRGKID